MHKIYRAVVEQENPKLSDRGADISEEGKLELTDLGLYNSENRSMCQPLTTRPWVKEF